MKEKIKVLVVDDAVVVRILVATTLSKDPEIEVVGKAQNGKIALDMIAETQPDIILLDLEMPEMDGLQVLKALREQRNPAKVIMFSTYTTVGAEQTFEALDLGAADFVPKPSNAGFSKGFDEVKEELLSKIKFIGSVRAPQTREPSVLRPTPSPTPRRSVSDYEVIVFEGGMGAPKTFMNIIPEIPSSISPGILIFQSMFSGFAEQFVRRLSKNAQISIKAAQHSDAIQSGQGFVLFGEHYVSVTRSMSKLQLAFREKDSEEKYGAVPRILCESIAKTCGEKAIAVILAGAGEVNIAGIQAMKERGALIVTEEPSTMMGRKVLDQLLERHLVDENVPSHEISQVLKRTIGF
jgi:two-component system chemotaxis response regulator CheB